MKRPPIRRIPLAPHITLLAREQHDNALVALKLFSTAGAADDPAGREGTANLVEQMLLEGTEHFTSSQIAERIEAEGVHLNTHAGKDSFAVSMLGTQEGFVACLPMLAEILSRPTFPADRLEIEKKLVVQDIREERDNPGEMVFQEFERRFYPGHPYAHPVSGEEETVPRIARDDVVAFYRGGLRSSHGVVAMAGDLSPEVVVEALAPALADWGNAESRPMPRPERQYVATTHRVTRQLDAQWVVMGYPAPGVHSPDYMALRVLDGLLSSGTDGSLFAEIRDRFGWAYQIGSSYAARRGPGFFSIYFSTSAEHLERVMEELNKLIAQLSREPLQDEHLLRLRTYLKGMFVMGAETNMSQATQFGLYETLGLGMDFPERFPGLVDAVSAEDLCRVAREYLREPTIVYCGREAAKSGTVTNFARNACG